MTSPLRRSSQLVIGCLKRVEKAADWLTGAAGPVFIALCWLLTGFGGLAFFDVILLRQSGITQMLFLPYALLVSINMYGHYWWCTRIDPGTPSFDESSLATEGRYWATPKGRPSSWRGGGGADIGVMDWHRGPGAQPSGEINKGMQVVEEQGHSFSPASSRQDGQPKIRRCRKCSGPKPDRTHHCSVCKKCVFMMDHHCPWINACVGLHNQRHFILFMAWLSLACWSLALAGYHAAWLSLEGADESWKGAITPPIGFTLIYVLAIAIGLAVPILLTWHVHLITRGETSIEAHDNEYFAKKAKEKQMLYVNPYDLGKRQNLELFFNVGPRGQYPLRTLLLPLRVPPASQGWTYPLHPFASRPEGPPEGVIVGDGEGDELTDDEEGGGGWIDSSG